MSLADRLRAIVRPETLHADGCPVNELDTPGLHDRGSWSQQAYPTDAAEILDGEWRDHRGQRYLIVDRRYAPGHRLGRVAVADCLPDQAGTWPRLELLLSAAGQSIDEGRVLFLDLETTGLAGGAGTYAFLLGCGWFEGAAFRIRQFLLPGLPGERAVLDQARAAFRDAAALVTYNGKAFDVPLLDTRFLFHRMEAVSAAGPHLDLLHAARRLWAHAPRAGVPGAEESERPSCRLTLLEETVLGYRREGDVSGCEIPSRYFHYVRSGDARPLVPVLEHNRIDLLALAMLTARAARLLAEGASAACTPREAFGLGRLYERRGLKTEALACFARAAEHPMRDPVSAAEALHAYAVLRRRNRHYGEAADAWRRLLALPYCPARLARDAVQALAVHHEHRQRDLAAARRFAIQALQFEARGLRVRAVQHRLARIDRKLGTATDAPLF